MGKYGIRFLGSPLLLRLATTADVKKDCVSMADRSEMLHQGSSLTTLAALAAPAASLLCLFGRAHKSGGEGIRTSFGFPQKDNDKMIPEPTRPLTRERFARSPA